MPLSALRANSVEPDVAEFRWTLRELGEVTVDPVSSRYSKESKIWFALLDRYHYSWKRTLVWRPDPICGEECDPGLSWGLGLQFGFLGDEESRRLYWMDRGGSQEPTWTVWSERSFFDSAHGQGETSGLPCLVVGAFPFASRLGAALPDSSCVGRDLCRSEPVSPGPATRRPIGRTWGTRAGRRDGEREEDFSVPSRSRGGVRFFARNRRFDSGRGRVQKSRSTGPRKNSVRCVCTMTGSSNAFTRSLRTFIMILRRPFPKRAARKHGRWELTDSFKTQRSPWTWC